MKNSNKLTVFLFHEISHNPSSFCNDFNLNVNPKLFKNQIKWIKKKYSIISPVELIKKSKLPLNPALITFDDAFEGAFVNGLTYLIKNKIPSIMFINMSHIIDRTPLISARAIYYKKFFNGFSSHIKKNFHLKLNPKILENLKVINNQDIDQKINQYQGSLVKYNILKKFSNNKFAFYGNHLFKHWNVAALSAKEFETNVQLNIDELRNFNNHINFFSFPNGQPNSCFNNENIFLLSKMGILKTFSSSGKTVLDSSGYLLDRIDLTEFEYSFFKFRYRLFISNFRSLYLRKLLGFLRRI